MPMVPRVGEYICLPGCDTAEEEVVRIMRVTYDMRHTRILLGVETISGGERKPWSRAQ